MKSITNTSSDELGANISRETVLRHTQGKRAVVVTVVVVRDRVAASLLAKAAVPRRFFVSGDYFGVRNVEPKRGSLPRRPSTTVADRRRVIFREMLQKQFLAALPKTPDHRKIRTLFQGLIALAA